MKDLLIIAHFTIFKSEGGNNRFNYIAERLGNIEHTEVELVTSSFLHNKKVQRNTIKEKKYKVTLLYEPDYKKNISISRFYSHFKLGKNLEIYLKRRKKPDCIYCAIPSLSVAQAASKYANENNIRFILDIQDLWPEAFEMVFKTPFLKSMLFYPIKHIADTIYASADDIIGVSETYKERALQVNKRVFHGHSVFLGTNLEDFDRYRSAETDIKKQKDEIWLTYIGTLGHSYDLMSVFKALEILREKTKFKIKFIVMGDGPLLKNLKFYAESKHLNVIFTGRLEYPQMAALLSKCDIAVNPINHGAAQSIINKVGDYSAAGLPVINTQECMEYRKLIERYDCGINCENGNEKDMAKAIYKLITNRALREKQGLSSRRLATELFDRKITYEEIVNVILSGGENVK